MTKLKVNYTDYSAQFCKECLKTYASEERRQASLRYFKTGKGEYGEGDEFIGVRVPDIRKVVQEFSRMADKDISLMAKSPIHEERVVGFLLWVKQYQKGSAERKEQIYKNYCQHFSYLNNWDLIDLTAPKIAGDYLYKRNRDIIFEWMRSKNLWIRRISVLTTFYFIGKGEFSDAIKVSTYLLDDEHDLIHKATGWMLREIGKRDPRVIEDFIGKNIAKMPRTMLRYAIEKFPEEKRQQILKIKVPK